MSKFTGIWHEVDSPTYERGVRSRIAAELEAQARRVAREVKAHQKWMKQRPADQYYWAARIEEARDQAAKLERRAKRLRGAK